MIPLEPVRETSAVARNFRRLATLVPDFAGKVVGVRFGIVTLSFTASTDSAAATVTHGLDHTPSLVLVGNTVIFGTRIVVAYAEAPGPSTFRVFGKADAAFTGTSLHYWLVIG